MQQVRTHSPPLTENAQIHIHFCHMHQPQKTLQYKNLHIITKSMWHPMIGAKKSYDPIAIQILRTTEHIAPVKYSNTATNKNLVSNTCRRHYLLQTLKSNGRNIRVAGWQNVLEVIRKLIFFHIFFV